MSLKNLFIDQSDSIGSSVAKASVASTGTLWAFSELDGAQVAGWVTALYVLFQLYVFAPKIFARLREDWRRFRGWFK